MILRNIFKMRANIAQTFWIRRKTLTQYFEVESWFYETFWRWEKTLPRRFEYDEMFWRRIMIFKKHFEDQMKNRPKGLKTKEDTCKTFRKQRWKIFILKKAKTYWRHRQINTLAKWKHWQNVWRRKKALATSLRDAVRDWRNSLKTVELLTKGFDI